MQTRGVAWLVALLVGVGLTFAVPSFAGEHGGGRGKGKSDENKDDDTDAKGKGKDKGRGGDTDKDKGGGNADKGHGGDADKGGGGNEGAKGGPHDADFHPPGWDKGKKKGWDDEYPPGWDKKTDGEKDKWKKDVGDAKGEVGLHADAKGVTPEEKTKLQEALERVCRRGKDVKQATDETVDAIKKGRKAIDILKDNGITVEVGQ
jgi:hypothetical protein